MGAPSSMCPRHTEQEQHFPRSAVGPQPQVCDGTVFSFVSFVRPTLCDDIFAQRSRTQLVPHKRRDHGNKAVTAPCNAIFCYSDYQVFWTGWDHICNVVTAPFTFHVLPSLRRPEPQHVTASQYFVVVLPPK